MKKNEEKSYRIAGSMKDDRHPQIAAGCEISYHRNESGEGNIDNSCNALVTVTQAEQRRAKVCGNDPAGSSAAKKISNTIEQISPVRHLLPKSGKRPGDPQPKKQLRHIADQGVEPGNVRRVAGDSGQQRSDGEKVERLRAHADSHPQENCARPTCRPPQTDSSPAGAAQPE